MAGNRKRHKLHVARLLQKVYDKLGDRCSNPACQWLNPDGSFGCADKRCLQIDHIYGDGGLERRKYMNRVSLLKRVLADTTNRYQFLCANCNWIKRRIERGEM